MNRNFFIGSVGQPGEGYDEENLQRCIRYKAHIMHKDTKHKGVFNRVKNGSIIFLKFNDNLLAYGEVIGIDTTDKPELNGWCFMVKIKEWYFFDEKHHTGSVSNYGVHWATLPGAGQMGTIKEVKSEFGISQMKSINPISEIYQLIINEVKIENNNTMINLIVNLVKANKNLIFTGAPGTGKTYLAIEIAKAMTGADADEKNPKFEFVQFHPSYDYTDFVEGLRPKKTTGPNEIGFSLEKGIFRAFCDNALKDPENDYVFVIDEINRGEISKIFGELFFSIDPGYRGSAGKVKTQYANLHGPEDQYFYVPENVYIIGTMNDIDRSVESFDFAMRRRFAWKEITAEESQKMFDSDEVWKDKEGKVVSIKNNEKISIAILKNRMNNLNKAIVDKKLGLSSSYQIGAAYFLKLSLYLNDSEPYNSLWKNHLLGLLGEYLRGTPKAGENLIILEAAYNEEKIA